MSENNKLVVVAIDFGTSNSGYAYTFRHEYKNNPTQIYGVTNWGEGSGFKTPTVILFDKSGQFHSFGYEAETKYADLAAEDEHTGWKYFRLFKMNLLERKTLKQSMTIKDEQGNSMLALDVFSASIKFFRNHFLKTIRECRGNVIEESDIHWVLTVPAIWDDAAKQFMTIAAEKAGIPSSQLTLAYEPEAAAIYCEKMNMAFGTGTTSLSIFRPGSKFMILDLGGGTVDITAHEVQTDDTLKSLLSPKGGPWGGTSVNKAFQNFLQELFGSDVLEELSKHYKPEKLELDRLIESTKKSFDPSNRESTTVKIKLPNEMYKIYQTIYRKEFDEMLSTREPENMIQKKRDRFFIKNELFLTMFDEAREQIIGLLATLLETPELQMVDTILMVGGFSQSKVIQMSVKNAFPQKKFFIPEHGDAAIVKGAVMYGHNKRSIQTRRLPFTYGISTCVPFDENKHEITHKVVKGGKETCEDIFKVFIKKDTPIDAEEVTKTHNVCASYIECKTATIEIYKTDCVEPMYINDPGCKRVGYLHLELEDQKRTEKPEIEVKMSFGGTSIEVIASECGTEREVQAAFNCFS